MNLLKRLWKDLWQNPWQPRYMWPLIIINITGSLYGYYWYHNQLMENPWYLWVLISDSPLSTTFFALALIFVLLGRGKPLITAIGTATTIKYGLWALVILTHYWVLSRDVRPVEAGLWIGHLGMVLEGFLFMRRAQIGPAAIAGAVAWIVLNDWADYVHNLHPYLFLPGQEGTAVISAMAITFGTVILIIKKTMFPGYEHK